MAQKANKLVKLNLRTGNVVPVTTIPGSLKTKIFRTNYFTRSMFRRSVLWGNITDDGATIFSTRDGIFRLNDDNNCICELDYEPKKYFLDTTICKNVKGFENAIYAGDYFSNPDMKPVSIWRRMSGNWEIVHTFPEKIMNHIHAIVPDNYNHCVWILTGDFDNGPTIWKAEENFSKVTQFFSPEQKYRACWLKYSYDKIIWATDTQLSKNAVYRCVDLQGSKDEELIVEIPGSSIYFSKINGYHFFSTTLEPERASRKNLLAWFDTKPAPVLAKDGAGIYVLCSDDSVVEILRTECGGLPLRIFEYPTFKFPNVVGKADFLCAYGRNVKHFNDSLIIYKLPN
ncbi:hypothetical protein [Spartinivicinus poritis]|uniref:Uncharacterized protein n=1 Tax=Spartinivicinus poritis TaxID=2994640 RepID=A0ABT5U7D6_9GAMM|nr:hypothetical protein [Spartinivicinus sp. A2-2]MDE1462275.1 hypothetical protein [Spartinivicinus sp. A2-2]